MRIVWTGTGTNPVFRVLRSIGGSATTTVSISRVTPYVARIQNIGGTSWSGLASVQVNDLLRFEKTTDSFTSPFSSTNQGKTYRIQAKGADYIDFVDNGEVSLDSNIVLGANFAFALRVISPSPVKINDIIEIEGAGINPSNIGKFTVTDVSSDYIEIINPLGYPETVLYGTNSLIVYEHLIGFLHLRSNGRIHLKFGNQTEWVAIEKLGTEAIFLGSICTHKIQAKNDNLDPVTISLQYASVL
jgi:hypothetical protein